MRKLILGYFRASNVDELRHNAKPVYIEHYEKVRRLVPPERLLEYKLGSGWGPICEFLGKEEPEEEFPWVNETAALHAKVVEFQRTMVKTAWKRLRPVLIMGGLAALAYASARNFT
jgi:hypothetical protein